MSQNLYGDGLYCFHCVPGPSLAMAVEAKPGDRCLGCNREFLRFVPLAAYRPDAGYLARKNAQ